jgi:hypothetical protein
MEFTSRFSTKQFTAIALIIIAVCCIIFVKPENAYVALIMITIAVIVGAFVLIYSEAKIRYKILSVQHQRKKFDSEQENKIAKYFERKNIIYEIHPKITLRKFWRGIISISTITIEPDFFLPEFNIYVEYWGLIENPEYKKNSYDRKKKLYEENDIDFISLYPKNLDNLDFVFTSKLLDSIKRREGNLRN